MEKTTYACDIQDCKNVPEHKKKSIQVIFTTDQTEGRSVAPYLSIETIDICQHCLDIVLKGNYVYGSGAQGHNTYTLKK
jgi:hypothetical protein